MGLSSRLQQVPAFQSGRSYEWIHQGNYYWDWEISSKGNLAEGDSCHVPGNEYEYPAKTPTMPPPAQENPLERIKVSISIHHREALTSPWGKDVLRFLDRIIDKIDLTLPDKSCSIMINAFKVLIDYYTFFYTNSHITPQEEPKVDILTTTIVPLMYMRIFSMQNPLRSRSWKLSDIVLPIQKSGNGKISVSLVLQTIARPS